MKKQYLIIGVVSILILTVSVSLGYWMAYIEGNGAPIDLTAQDLKITFDGNGNIEANNIEPGWTYKKTFTVTSETNETYEYKIIIKDLINTFKTDYLKYKITSSHGYTMDKFEVLPKSETAKKISLTGNIKIEPSEVQEYTIEFIYETTTEDQSEDMGATLSGTLFIGEGDKPFLAQDLFTTKYTKEELNKKRNDFSTIVTEGSVYMEDGAYTEGSKPVYYFAGNVEDNWVYFANYYWRIIRSDEDGGLRLLYAGSSPTAEDAYISTMAYNKDNRNNTAYVGYMYSTGDTLSAIRGNGTPSPIKTELDTWYANNLQSYDKYISKTAIYCNDRSSQTGWASSGTMYYNGYTKFYTNKTSSSGNHPSFKCGVDGTGKENSDSTGAEGTKDKFSVSKASGGNGALTKPIGLMTADEVIFAGGLFTTNNDSAYYYRNASGGSSTGSNTWWTMSPCYFSSSAYVFIVRGSSSAGQLLGTIGNASNGVVRPVISLKGCVTLEGSGTADNPYKVIKECPLTAGSLGETKYASAGKRSSFDSIVTDGNVYTEDDKWTENGSKVWYWAGNTTDNWVHFADKYWRIIRTNEDGGLRLLYAGESPESQTAYIMNSGNIGSNGLFEYNKDNYDNTAYVGYMYSTGDTLSAIRGNGTPSPIMTELETWYTSNLQSYDKYISKTAIYCNDRSSQTGWKSSGEMDYNGYTKFNANKLDNSKNHPSFKCGVDGTGKENSDSTGAEGTKDKFSVSQASGGNGKLTKPIGLMTADEVIFAGGLYQTNNDSVYYYRNASGGSPTGTNRWWTMSPYRFLGLFDHAYVFYVSYSIASFLDSNYVGSSSGTVRPVISLKSCVQLSGTGKSDDPYEVVEIGNSDSCATKDN